MSQMSLVNTERALENRAHVRILLRLRQPAFAAALASAEQDFSHSVRSGRRPEQDNESSTGFIIVTARLLDSIITTTGPDTPYGRDQPARHTQTPDH
jgi:hypothetical protein